MNTLIANKIFLCIFGLVSQGNEEASGANQ